MKRWTAKQWAGLGIAVQFLALVRTLGEYFRLKHEQGEAFDPAYAEHFVRAALGIALLTGLAVLARSLDRPRTALALAALTVLLMLVYKYAVM